MKNDENTTTIARKNVVKPQRKNVIKYDEKRNKNAAKTAVKIRYESIRKCFWAFTKHCPKGGGLDCAIPIRNGYIKTRKFLEGRGLGFCL
jgi:hypothetical protein